MIKPGKNTKILDEKIHVVYIGNDNPLSLRNGKTYEARALKKGWYGIVDESGEEYAFPPNLFTQSGGFAHGKTMSGDIKIAIDSRFEDDN